MTKPLTLGALLAATVALAGCGSSNDASTGAAAPAAAAGTTKTQTLSKQEKGVKFAECIRGHGVSDFPDPDPKGDYNYGVSVSRQVWLAATEACKSMQPPGTLSSKRSVKEQSDALQFAACVRANGVKDFPDPVNGEPLIDTYKIPSSNRPGGMDILNAATAKCGDLMRKAIEAQG
jgi:hypothetical protein